MDAGATAIHDQIRDGQPQGPDYFGYVTPSFGFHDRLELGIPVGVYLPNGLGPRGKNDSHVEAFLLMPYIKSALLPPGRDHLAVTIQTSWFAPSNLSLVYGRELGKWEPQVGASVIFSGGPAGDDPVVTRYQQSGQFMFALSVGATWNGPARAAFEIGVLRNHYQEGAVFGNFGQPTTPRTLYDLFAGVKVGLTGH